MKEKAKYTRLVYGVLLGIMTVITGALLAGFVWEIYVGEEAFTRANVGKQLLRAMPAICIWLVMAVGGFAIWEVFPEPKQKRKADVRYTLYRLKKRMPETAEGDLKASLDTVRREERILKILWSVAAALCLGAAVYVIVYLATPSNFPRVENPNKPVLEAVKHVMPCVAAAFAVCLGVAVYEGVSAGKQLKAASLLAKGAVKPEPKRCKIILKLEAKAEHSKFFAFLSKLVDFNVKHRVAVARVIVGCVGVSFIIAGVCNGSMREVFTKAIAICTECIGLG